jgi:lipopolysaccharide/colanic/teichoic acid biosynthesis glycosyltransferase
VLKRTLDIAASAAGLVLLSPLMLAIALFIKLDSPGPVFFRQVRVGRHGQPFRIFKFRTMLQVQAAGAPQLTAATDARITRAGKWLRRTKLDELPQLIDVLRGTMSLVGPRPEVPRYVEHYPEQHRERVLSVRPGITDFASVHYRNEGDLLARAADPEREYLDVILPSKLRYAMHYVDNVSVADDLRVLGLTLRTVFVPTFPTSKRWLAMNDSKVWGRLDRAMSSLHPRRNLFAALSDAATVLVCWHVTYLFRLGFERYQPGRPWYDDYVSFGVVAVYLVCLALAGAGRSVWRYFGFDDLKRITVACLMAGLVSAAAVLMAQLSAVARAVLLLHPLFCIAGLSIVRMVYRMVWEQARLRVNGQQGEPRRAIVLGAGEAARRLIAGIHLRDGWTVLALLDDDPAKRGSRVGGLPVLGPLADLLLPHIRAEATHVIVAMPGAPVEQRARAIALAKEAGLLVLTVPSQRELQGDAEPLAGIQQG